MAERRPVEITFDAEQEVSGLKIVARLNASNKLSEATVKIVAGNVQVAAGPRATEICADICLAAETAQQTLLFREHWP
ncbi:hypothetical protein Q3C01_43135 [Bradyrhizobium sp. UFLA05-109]